MPTPSHPLLAIEVPLHKTTAVALAYPQFQTHLKDLGPSYETEFGINVHDIAMDAIHLRHKYHIPPAIIARASISPWYKDQSFTEAFLKVPAMLADYHATRERKRAALAQSLNLEHHIRNIRSTTTNADIIGKVTDCNARGVKIEAGLFHANLPIVTGTFYFRKV